MLKTLLRGGLALCVGAGLVGCSPAAKEPGTGRAYYDAARDPNSEISVSGAWARPSIGGGHEGHSNPANSAIYLQIKNAGAVEDTLIGVSGDAARAFELHESKDMDGVMRMLPLPDGVAIPMRSTVELKPAGKHIMMVDVTKQLTADSFFVVTLTFKSGRVIRPEVVVQAP